MIEKFTVSRDDGIYEAFPDLALTRSGELVCVFAECTHHADRGYTRILPLDFDRSPQSDTGYSGWAQFPDGEIYVVNYILDDAAKAQIRGYSLRERDFLLER